jgi:dTDP-4-dehydrorhamnose reductase
VKFLITGGKGRLGSSLAALLTANGHEVGVYDLDEIDVTEFPAVRDLLHAQPPNWVLHCAAWTDVDGCAREPERAVVVNGCGAGNVAAAAYEVGAGVLYVSSNEVFDGKRGGAPYYEYDTPNPVNPYGYSKYVGEQETARLNPRHMIVRTSWLFAHGGKNFTQSIINAARAGKELRVVVDEVAHPTYTNDLAAGIAAQIGRAHV